MNSDNLNYRIELAKALIDEIGFNAIREACGISQAAISQWKVNGLPREQERYFRKFAKKLNVWQIYPADEQMQKMLSYRI